MYGRVEGHFEPRIKDHDALDPRFNNSHPIFQVGIRM